jgi:LCP family protein required for cell wall assembly
MCIFLNACAQEVSQPETDAGHDVILAVFGADTSSLPDQRNRADMIKIIRYDPDADIVRILSVQRDTMAEIPGYGFSKINRAHDLGGAVLQLKTVEKNLDLDIHNFISFSFASLKELIEHTGGLELPLSEKECSSLGITYDPDRRTYLLNGDQVLAYVRLRSIDDDWHRIRRQDLVIRQLADRYRFAAPSQIMSLLNSLSAAEIRIDPEAILCLHKILACPLIETASYPFTGTQHIRNLVIDGIDNIYEPMDLMSEVCDAHRWLLDQQSCTFREPFLDLKNRMYAQYPIE